MTKMEQDSSDDHQHTKKHETFLRSKIDDEPVTAVPGVGEVGGERLSSEGYPQAVNVIGEYLVQNKSAKAFDSSLETYGHVTNDGLRSDIVDAVQEKVDTMLESSKSSEKDDRTKKHEMFLRSKIDDEPVTAVPGVGKVGGERLANEGYPQAVNVIGEYLVQNKSAKAFDSSLETHGHVTNDGLRSEIVDAVQEKVENMGTNKK